MRKVLTPKQKDQIRQVAASMALENMYPSKLAYRKVIELTLGEKTIDQVIKELDEVYTQKEGRESDAGTNRT